jgi:hypothetical protein
LLASLVLAAAVGAPLALHPANPRYFLFGGKPAVLVTSGEHYGAVLNLDFDYVRYLDALAKDGLDLTRVFSGTYREVPASFGITENTLAPRPGRYCAPWARSTQPGESDGGMKFDLARWDESYFRRLADLMAEAERRGIVVEVNLFCPLYEDALWAANPMNARNNVNGVGAAPREEVYTLKHPDLTRVQDAVATRIVTALAGGGLFNSLDYSFTAAHPDGTFLDYTSPGGGSPALRKQLGVLKRFVQSFDFVRMHPDPSIVAAPAGLSAQALVEEGRQYAVYVHAPLGKTGAASPAVAPPPRGPITIAIDLPPGRYRAEWLDPKTGAQTEAGDLEHAGGRKSLSAPSFDDDLALSIRGRP